MHSLRDQYEQMHQGAGKFRGDSLVPHVNRIRKLCEKHKARSLLDYGCGKASQYKGNKVHVDWGIDELALYDPFYYPYSLKPEGKYDVVICTDVMEHVPQEELAGVWGELKNYADKAIFMSISTKPAKKTLPDGRNAHVTVRPPGWWEQNIRAFFMNSGVEVVVEYVE